MREAVACNLYIHILSFSLVVVFFLLVIWNFKDPLAQLPYVQ